MTLRVAMVVDRFPHEPFIAQQVAALLRRSVDVQVLCQIHDRRSAAYEFFDSGAGLDTDIVRRVHPWPNRGKPLALGAAGTATAAKVLVRRATRTAAARAVRAEHEWRRSGRGLAGRVLFDARLVALQPDVVHFQFGDLARHRVHVADAVDAAFTASFRGYDLSYAGLEQPGYYDQLWPRLDGAHTLGRELQDLAAERGAPLDLDWSIIPPAVDLARFETPEHHGRLRSVDQPIRILSVGRLHWKKGLPDGLVAVAGLKSRGLRIQYRIVGEGPAEEQIRWAVRDLGLSDTVELVGATHSAGVRDQLRWADILLHPALTEGFGNAVLEAQAMALPVVCTDAEGLRENVVDGKTGLVVARRRPEALTAALARLTADSGLRWAMGNRGRQRVIDHFGLDQQTDAFVQFFTEAAERARHRRS